MILRYMKRMLTETEFRLLFKFAYNFGWKGMRSVNKFQKRIKKGNYFPAFMFISVTNNCNLSCQGCWVTPTKPIQELDEETLNRLITEGKQQGVYFYGILGGEPLLHKKLLDVFENHSDCYFLLFTNGIPITDSIAARMRELGNISPLVSIEGNEIISDVRRGGSKVYSRSLEGLKTSRKHRLITGVATSICKSNINDLATETFIDKLIDLEVHYLWYYIYRPVGPNPSPDLALSQEEIIQLREFMVNIRSKMPLMIVDSYWDHEGNALCPAATGIGHHISPGGYIEPCPPIQFARDTIYNGKAFYDTMVESTFLESFRNIATAKTRGCILMDDPNLLKETMMQTEAIDSSGRKTAMKELSKMSIRPSHHIPGMEIPEKYWPYKLAKKYWFFGFGAYG